MAKLVNSPPADPAIHPLRSIMAPETATDSIESPEILSDAETDIRNIRCPVEMFRAKSFCIDQQNLVDSIRDKVERYRHEMEASRGKDVSQSLPEDATNSNTNLQKKRSAKVNAEINNFGKHPSFNFEEDEPRQASEKCQGDLPRRQGKSTKKFPSSHKPTKEEKRDKAETPTARSIASATDVPRVKARAGL